MRFLRFKDSQNFFGFEKVTQEDSHKEYPILYKGLYLKAVSQGHGWLVDSTGLNT